MLKRKTLRPVGCLLVLGALLTGRAARSDDELKLLTKLRKAVDPKTVEPSKDDDDMQRLLKERYRTAASLLELRVHEYLTGRMTQDQLAQAFMRVRNARLDMTDKPAERIAILELTVEMGKEAEEVADARFKAGRLGKADVESARLFRLEAELALLREKHKLDPPKPR
jgi:hypothetical protein